jgi:hypothetical protein
VKFKYTVEAVEHYVLNVAVERVGSRIKIAGNCLVVPITKVWPNFFCVADLGSKLIHVVSV